MFGTFQALSIRIELYSNLIELCCFKIIDPAKSVLLKIDTTTV